MSIVSQSPLTAELFEARRAEAPGCELVRGEVVRVSPGGMEHSSVSGRIGGMLWAWTKRSGAGRVLTNEAGLITERDPDTVRGADIAYYSYARLPKGKLPAGFSSIPPELIVEVLGPRQSWTDAMQKIGEYLRMGVERIWVADPASRSVHVFRADAPPAQFVGDGELREEHVLPGFVCRVSELFED